MPVNLSIKNVTDELAQLLRERATRHHRSLQGELMVILEQSVEEKTVLSPRDVLDEVLNLGLSTGAEAGVMIRDEREKR